MNVKIHPVLFSAMTALLVAGCGDDGPCLEGGDDGDCVAGQTGDTGDTGGGTPECAPFDEPKSGTSFYCQGDGTGWLVADVYGAGKANPITTCLAYNTDDIPANPTPDDCAAIPLDLIPYNIPAPAACCTEVAKNQNIIDACMDDCGYAACKTAAAAMRAAADALMAPDGLPQAPFDTSKADLYAYASVLEAPDGLEYCAEKVSASPGEIVSLDLDSGVSSPAALGHINNATVFLSCGLDPGDPYLADPEAGECTEPTNITVAVAETHSEGVIKAGGIEIAGPGVDTFVSIIDANVSTSEVLNDDMSVDFTLTSFDATLLDLAVSAFEFRNPQIHLVDPATGTLDAQTVTFAPGSLRFEVTATLLVDGLSLFSGLPMTAEYANKTTATATRGTDGSFQFVDATFTAGAYTAVLHTDPCVLDPLG